jgi:hypothetical protein
MANPNAARSLAKTRATGLRRARGQALNVLGLGTFGAGHNFETDHFALIQGLKPIPDNRRVMHEDIRAGFLDDEAKPMLVIEPFYFATGHNFPLLKV